MSKTEHEEYYGTDSWIWIPDENNVFDAARVIESFSAGSPGLVCRANGEVVQLNAVETRKVQRMDELAFEGVTNMVDLKELNEASILNNLRLRFNQDEIYTSVGSILVATNPFKLVPLYTTDFLENYKTQGARDLPPHVYGIADNAYKGLIQSKANQSCIVSGESGAGKTETTKIFLQYLTEVSTAMDDYNYDDNAGSASLQEQILKANPLMEAFGNAKTVRNNNSSRFGKWTEVSFHQTTGKIVGGSIVQYLLEKSRIVTQAEEERNYHVFYFLCAGAQMDSYFKEKFHIQNASSYHYLNQSGVYEVEGMSDERGFENMLNSMEAIGIGNDEQDEILGTIGGILQLGNIQFTKGGSSFEDGSAVTNTAVVERAASLLGLDATSLANALCYTKVKTGRETVLKTNNVTKAAESRDVLAKQVYSKLFEWLVQRINRSLAVKDEYANQTSIIGVLDIFGFESFTQNSFEQLCINYCNEKLQFHFNEHIFRFEQEEYQAQGVTVSHVSFSNNELCLKLFEEKRTGVFACLDEEINIPQGSDMGFLNKVVKTHGSGKASHPNFRNPAVKSPDTFTVVHYAGSVTYSVDSFLDKNRDKISEDVMDLLCGSSKAIVSNLVANKSSASSRVSVKLKRSLGSKFQSQLNDLMELLHSTEPHYVRCIKPNDSKMGNKFEPSRVLDQIRCAGLLEVCRIRQLGFPVRQSFGMFEHRYLTLARQASSAPEMCAMLEKNGLLQPSDYRIGRSKVFLKSYAVNTLEGWRDMALRSFAIRIQKIIRSFLARRAYSRYQATITDIKLAMQKRNLSLLTSACAKSSELPHHGNSLDVVSRAWKLVQVLKEETRVVELLHSALETSDINGLKAAITAADELALHNAYYDQACTQLQTLESRKSCIELIKSAMTSRDIVKVKGALEQAHSLGLAEVLEVQQCQILLKRLEQERERLAQLENAKKSQNIDELKLAITAAVALGLQSSVVSDAQALVDKLIKDAAERERLKKVEEESRAARNTSATQATSELVSAAKNRDLKAYAIAKSKILELGVTGEEVDRAQQEAELEESLNEIIRNITCALEPLQKDDIRSIWLSSHDVKRLSSAIAAAEHLGLSNDLKEYEMAITIEEKCMIQLEAQAILQRALDTSKLDDLQGAVDIAEELGLTMDVAIRVRELYKARNTKARMAAANPADTETSQGDMAEMLEARHRDNATLASNERYHFSKFYKIRSDADYVKSLFFHKKKVAENKLRFQNTPIPKSLTELDKEHNKIALGIHKSILGYCGEQLMSFPATLAQDIFVKGLQNQILVDEIFVQICKHITDNVKPESLSRAWQLMCMAVETMTPSKDFELYLMNFIMYHATLGGAMKHYSRYALRRFDAMMVQSATGYVPSIDEILAYKDRPPILATIELVDGTPVTTRLPMPPSMTVENILKICNRFLALSEEKSKSFGIFVAAETDTGGNQMGSSYSASRGHVIEEKPGTKAKASPQWDSNFHIPMQSKDYMGDMVLKMSREDLQPRFIFKRRIIRRESPLPSDDAVFNRLAYIQAKEDVHEGNVIVTREGDLAQLVAIAMFCDHLDLLDDDQIIMEELDDYIPDMWLKKRDRSSWVKPIASAFKKLVNKSVFDLQVEFLNIAVKLPLYGHCKFVVQKEPEGDPFICSVFHSGIHFLSSSQTKLQEFSFSEIHRWGGSISEFWVLVYDKKSNQKAKLTVYTEYSRNLSALLLDYALLAAK